MPFINGRFYINPAYGRAVEAARAAEATSQHHETDQQEPGAHWVTIDGRHVLIQETQAGRAQHPAHAQHAPLPPAVKQLVEGDYIKYSECVKKETAGKVADEVMGELTKQGMEAAKSAAQTPAQGLPSPGGINYPSVAIAGAKGMLSAQADCLRKFPLAALDPRYNGPPPGEVFEGVPPFSLLDEFL